MKRDDANTIRAARALLSSLGPAQVPGDLAERAAAVAIATPRAERAPSFIDRLIGVALPAAAMGVVAALVLVVLSARTSDETTASASYSDPVGTLTADGDYGYDDPTATVLGGGP